MKSHKQMRNTYVYGFFVVCNYNSRHVIESKLSFLHLAKADMFIFQRIDIQQFIRTGSI